MSRYVDAIMMRTSAPEKLAELARHATVPVIKHYKGVCHIFVDESAAALTSILADVPVHVIPCIERRFDRAPLVVEATAYASIIPAAWSFLLALRSRGLGSVWTTLHLAKEREVAQLLGIPATVTQIALFPVAYTVGTDFKPAKRPPVETITSWNTWGAH